MRRRAVISGAAAVTKLFLPRHRDVWQAVVWRCWWRRRRRRRCRGARGRGGGNGREARLLGSGGSPQSEVVLPVPPGCDERQRRGQKGRLSAEERARHLSWSPATAATVCHVRLQFRVVLKPDLSSRQLCMCACVFLLALDGIFFFLSFFFSTRK